MLKSSLLILLSLVIAPAAVAHNLMTQSGQGGVLNSYWGTAAQAQSACETAALHSVTEHSVGEGCYGYGSAGGGYYFSTYTSYLDRHFWRTSATAPNGTEIYLDPDTGQWTAAPPVYDCPDPNTHVNATNDGCDLNSIDENTPVGTEKLVKLPYSNFSPDQYVLDPYNNRWELGTAQCFGDQPDDVCWWTYTKTDETSQPGDVSGDGLVDPDDNEIFKVLSSDDPTTYTRATATQDTTEIVGDDTIVTTSNKTIDGTGTTTETTTTTSTNIDGSSVITTETTITTTEGTTTETVNQEVKDTGGVTLTDQVIRTSTETEEKVSATASGGTSCDLAPSCAGDEVMCLLVQQQFNTRCEIQVQVDDTYLVDQGTTAAGQMQTTLDDFETSYGTELADFTATDAILTSTQPLESIFNGVFDVTACQDVSFAYHGATWAVTCADTLLLRQVLAWIAALYTIMACWTIAFTPPKIGAK